MKKGLAIGIAGISVLVVIVAIVLTSAPKSDVIEVDAPNIVSDVENPKIQEKLDNITKINLENNYNPKEREWQTSGPFQIDRTKYAIGEKIFVIIGALNPDEKGQITFMRPLNSTHYSVYMTIPFDGQKKDAFNYYLDPHLSKPQEICSIDDLTGKWAVVFRGTNYPNLYFEITNDVVPGTNIEPVC